jgi:predicted CopG family antitoxin
VILLATKTISITEDAYDILKVRKDEAESFSEVIVRLGGKRKLASFAGVLNKSTADIMEKDMKEVRAIHKKLHLKRLRES